MSLFRKDNSAGTAEKQELWSKDDEKYFFKRYSQPGSDRPDYLTDQANSLYVQNVLKDDKITDSVIRILETYDSDFPNDKIFKATAYYLRGLICRERGDTDRMFEFFKKAADAEIVYPERLAGGGLDYAEHIVKYGRTELYGEAKKYAGLYKIDDPDTPLLTYRISMILLAIAESDRDTERQGHYKKRAEAALNTVAGIDKKLRCVKMIKVKDLNEKVEDRIRLFMLRNGFGIGMHNGIVLLQKKHSSCFHNVIVEPVFDTIFVIAFVLSYMGETGLDGFVSIAAKRPLKKIIDDFERTFTDM